MPPMSLDFHKHDFAFRWNERYQVDLTAPVCVAWA